jgi:inosine/guanosine/xanthosine phosphorylase family protein
METWEALESPLMRAAEALTARLGAPRVGVILGSGFGPFASAVGEPVGRVRFVEVEGLLPPRVDGHDATVEAHRIGGATAWIFRGRLHLYEGHSVARVVQSVRVLAFAGARGVLLTCAAGGISDRHAPGTLMAVEDHINLTGADPVAAIPPDRRDPAFLDLQGTYDGAFLAAWGREAERSGVPLPRGILAAVRGPCYETPAEVRMLRVLGADAVTMSTVPETMAARYLRLRVAALACVANHAAGTGSGPVRHEDVLAAVAATAEDRAVFFRRGLEGMLEAVRR